MPQHGVGAVAVEVADHRVEALAVDHHRHRGEGRTAVPDAVRGRAGSIPEDVAAAVAIEVAGDRDVVARHGQGCVAEPAVGSAAPEQVALGAGSVPEDVVVARSEEHTSELQSLMRISYAVFCLKKKKKKQKRI